MTPFQIQLNFKYKSHDSFHRNSYDNNELPIRENSVGISGTLPPCLFYNRKDMFNEVKQQTAQAGSK